MKVQITKSLTGRFNMAHFEGELVEFPEQFAGELIELGYAIETPESHDERELELAVKDVKVEMAKKGRPGK